MTILVGDSTALLPTLADPNTRTFFYLDAHSRHGLPLRREIEIALGGSPRSILMVDDFKVPDDPGYGFDRYSDENQITIEYVRKAEAPLFAIFLPSTLSADEVGAKRGYAVLSADAEIVDQLEKMPLLRRWNDRLQTG